MLSSAQLRSCWAWDRGGCICSYRHVPELHSIPAFHSLHAIQRVVSLLPIPRLTPLKTSSQSAHEAHACYVECLPAVMQQGCM